MVSDASSLEMRSSWRNSMCAILAPYLGLSCSSSGLITYRFGLAIASTIVWKSHTHTVVPTPKFKIILDFFQVFYWEMAH